MDIYLDDLHGDECEKTDSSSLVLHVLSQNVPLHDAYACVSVFFMLSLSFAFRLHSSHSSAALTWSGRDTAV